MLQMDPTPEHDIEIALAHHRAGRVEEAELVYRSILSKHPGHPEALKYLGVLAGQLGHHDQGLELLRMAHEATPADAEIYVNRGMILQQLGRNADAQVAYQEALRLGAQLPEVHNLLGSALHAQGLFAQAIEQYRQALEMAGDFLPALGNMAAAQKDLGQWEEAARICHRMIELSPQMPEAYLQLAIVLGEAGKLDEAVEQVKRGLELDENNSDAWDLLGQLLAQQGKLPEAAGCHLHAISLDANTPRFHAHLGDALAGQGHLDKAIEAYRHAMALDPKDPQVHSRLLVAMGRLETIEPRAVYEEALNWGRAHAEKAPKFNTHANVRDPQKVIRIGYVSPAFETMKAGGLSERIVSGHDPARVEAFCYSDARGIHPLANVRWRDVAGLPDERFCQIVREDQIDILVDLVGHLPGNRLLALARRPAPVQVSWGFPHTTGMTEIDYRLTNTVIPAGGEKYYSEKVVRLTTNSADLVRDLERAYRRMWGDWCRSR